MTRFIECRDGIRSPTPRTGPGSIFRWIAATVFAVPARVSASRAGTSTGSTSSTRDAEDEDAEGDELTCQMVPESDCAVRILATSDIAKTGPSSHHGRIRAIQRLSDSTVTFSIALDDEAAIGSLPGQYVNIAVPGTGQTRSYSFSLRPGRDQASSLLRDTPTGALPTFLRGPAEVNHPIEFHGPFGTVYLRDIK